MQKETAQNTSKGIPDGITTKPQHSKTFSPESQCNELLTHFQAGKSITHYEASQMGIMGFSSRISELRQAGYNIVCSMQPFINKHGRTIMRGVFSLVSVQGEQP